MNSITVHKFVSPLYFENTYVVTDAESRTALVIDPGSSCWGFVSTFKDAGFVYKGIVITHGHFDHVFELKKIKTKTRAPIYMHKDDLFLFDDFEKEVRRFVAEPARLPLPDYYFDHGDILELGKVKFEVIHVPGHTPGSICLKWDEGVFTGDTLMYRKIGNCSEEHAATLATSLKERLYTLPDDLVIYPGHFAYSTIGDEKRFNTTRTGAASIEIIK